MAATRQNPPSATNAERAESDSVGGLKLALSVSQPTDSGRDARGVESALTFEDRHAAYCAGLDDGMTYQVRVDAEYAALHAAADGIPDVSAQLSRIEALLGQVLLRMGGVG